MATPFVLLQWGRGDEAADTPPTSSPGPWTTCCFNGAAAMKPRIPP